MVALMRLYQLEDSYTLSRNMQSLVKKMKGIEVCTNRFDNDTKNSFIELYTKVDGSATEQIAEQQRQSDIDSQMDDNDSESDDG